MRHVMHRVKHAVSHKAKQPKYMIPLVIGAVLLLLMIAMYLFELWQLSSISVEHPVACRSLASGFGREQCDARMTAAFSAVAPLERSALCKDIFTRSKYGESVVLCDAYDHEVAAQYYNSTLEELGISVWEPMEQVVTNGSVRIKTLERLTKLTLLCDGSIIPSTWTSEDEWNTLHLQEPVKGNCKAIATSQSGSVTSKEFFLETR
jgi:hypothetical protein